MKSNILSLILMIGSMTPLWAAVQTDTHTYIVGSEENAVLSINRQTGQETVIPVGQYPISMVLHGGFGYVLNMNSHNVSVINLTTNTVTQTIPVGMKPQSMLIHGDIGYVVNVASSTVSVLDLQTHTVSDTVSLGLIDYMKIQGGIGYIYGERTTRIKLIDLRTNKVIGYLAYPHVQSIDFSDTHVYLGLKKYGPFYPTLASINLAKAAKTLGEFVSMMPEVFKLGEIESRLLPKEQNLFDTLPPYVLAQKIFWDVDTNKPLMDPKDILATLVTMKYPQKLLKSKDLGYWLRNRLHTAFFRTVWVGDIVEAKTMLTYFVQLRDPVITKLATYTFKKTPQGATNSTALD